MFHATSRLARGGISVVAALMMGVVGVSAASAQQLEKITISAIASSPQGPNFIAQERGYFKQEGLDAQLLMSDNLDTVTMAVAAGSADVSGSSLNVALINTASKGALKIISGLANEQPRYRNSAIIVTNAAWDAGLRSFKDLKGKRIGISTTGSATHLAIGLIGEKYGFDMSQVTLVPLQSLANMAAAFQGGQIDALSAASPLPSKVSANNGGHILGWVGDETPWQAGVAYANAASIKNKRPIIEKYLRALAHGARDYNTALNTLDADGNVVKGADYDAVVAIIAKYTQVPIAQLQIAGFPYIDPKLHLDVPNIETQIKFWQSQKVVANSVDASQIVDTSFAK